MVYQELVRKYGPLHMFVQYYGGSGDVYLSAAYIQWAQDAGQLPAQEAIFCVRGRSAENLSRVLVAGVTAIERFDGNELLEMCRLFLFLGGKTMRISILHYLSHYPVYTSILLDLVGLNGTTFFDLYEYTVFGNQKIMPPRIAEIPGAEKLFADLRLKPNRTVLLAPYSESIPKEMGMDIWALLAARLKERGYSVCTNIVPNKEAAVPGTEGVFIPYGMLAPFLRLAGFFVSYRSGLCDIVAAVHGCKKIVVYPKASWIDRTLRTPTMTVFSLKDFAFNLVELEAAGEATVYSILEALEQ